MTNPGTVTLTETEALQMCCICLKYCFAVVHMKFQRRISGHGTDLYQDY